MPLNRISRRIAVCLPLALVLIVVSLASLLGFGKATNAGLVAATCLGAAAVLGAFAMRSFNALDAFLTEIFYATRRLASGDRKARVQPPSGGEGAELGQALNDLAGAIEAGFAELSRDKAQLATILSNIVEAVVAVDAQGRVVAANPALCALFAVNPESVREKPFVEVLRHARIDELLAAVLKEKKVRTEEIAILAPEERLFEAHAVPLAQEGRYVGALLVLHDMTRLRHLERMRRDFVANVSHELRTPLASIRGFAETLREGGLDDAEHRLEFVVEIEKDAERLTALVDDLLDLTAIESGHRQPVKEPLNLLALTCEAAASLRPLAERRKVAVEIEPAAGLPQVRADRAQLKQVFTNLLDNAVKFSGEGATVRVSAESDAGKVRVSVQDSGIGIPAADLPRVFERFYRVDKARSRELGGTGLGLSIVKHIVEIHGGEVSVESEPGRGSTFTVVLPV